MGNYIQYSPLVNCGATHNFPIKMTLTVVFFFFFTHELRNDLTILI